MLSKIIWSISTIALTLTIFGTQRYLTTRKAWQLGAIVPSISLVAMTALYFVKQVAFSVEFVVPCAIILALELFMWVDGRQQYHKNELLKMKIKDIE